MHNLTVYLLVGIAALCVLATTGPRLVALSHAAVPLIAAIGIVVVVVRLVFFHTRRW